MSLFSDPYKIYPQSVRLYNTSSKTITILLFYSSPGIWPTFHPLVPGLLIPRSKEKGLLAKKECSALGGLWEFKKSYVPWTLQLLHMLTQNLTDSRHGSLAEYHMQI